MNGNIPSVILSIFILSLGLLCKESPEISGEQQSSEQSMMWDTLDHFKVGFLIIDGVYNTELTAPLDIFHHTIFRKGIKPMQVFTVAIDDTLVTSFEGLRLIPDFIIPKNPAPEIDILVVPSAEHHLDTDLENRAMLDFVRQSVSDAEFVISLCDGAFVLAKAGLLDSVASTTFPGDLDAYRKMFPGLDIRDGAYLVHDGKFITSAGGARSFDAALYLCEYLYGKEIADQLARGLVIDWDINQIRATVVK